MTAAEKKICVYFPHLCNGCGTAESSQFHQLVHTEAILAEQLFVYVLGLFLAVGQQRLSLDLTITSRHLYKL